MKKNILDTGSLLNTTTGISDTGKSNPRILAFDFARGIAIVMMVLIHTVVFIGGPDLLKTSAGYVVNSIVCIFAAPVFMFVMGLLFSLSSKTSFQTQMKRGFLIFLLGYLLNILRGTIPVFTGLMFGWVEDDSPWDYLPEIDILQFAGLALMSLALVKRFLPWKESWLVLGLITAFISANLWGCGSDQPVIHYLFVLFTGGEHYAFFPFFPWIAFPLIGMTYGAYFKNSPDKNGFFKKGIFIGLILLIAGIVITFFGSTDIWKLWYTGKFRQGQLPFSVVLIFSGFQFLWLPVCQLITAKVKENRFFSTLYFWSRNVTAFYFIQWVIIGWICVMLYEIEWPATFLFVALIIFFTDKFTHMYLNMRNKQ